MFNFFYNSLETLKQVKKPTRKEVLNITLQIFVIVIISWLFFAFTDGIFAAFYNQFFNMFNH